MKITQGIYYKTSLFFIITQKQILNTLRYFKINYFTSRIENKDGIKNVNLLN